MYYAIDILLLAILVILIIRGQRKGFIRMLLETVGYIASSVAAWFVSNKFAAVVYDSYFKAGVVRGIKSRFSEDGSMDALNAAFYSIPSNLRGIAEKIGFNAESLTQKFSDSDTTTANAIEQTVVGPIVTVVLKILLFIVVFVLCSIIFKFLISIISRVTKLPVIKSVDGVMGAVLGLLNGVIVVVSIAAIIFAVTGIIDNDAITEKVSGSYIIQFVEKLSLIITSSK